MVRSLSFLLAAVLVVGLLTGCFMPLFDLETSLAYQTASKMTKIATVGPIGEYSRDRFSSGADYYYVPSRNLPPGYGLFVEADDFGVSISYLAPDPAEDNRIRRVGDNIEWVFDNGDVQNLDFVVLPIATPAPPPEDAFFVAFPQVGDESDARLQTFTFDVAGQNFTTPGTELASTVTTAAFPPAEALAVGIDIRNTPGAEAITLLLREDSPTGADVYNGAITGSPSGPVVSSPFGAPTTAPLPDSFEPTGGTAAYDSASAVWVYSNYDTAGYYNVYRWDSTLIVEKLPLRQRIDAILATGELYHRGANSDEVYDDNGRRKYSIPTGKLHFAYEITIASVPTMFYTLVYFDEVGDRDDDNMYIDIYAIPTGDLGDLE
jgi:hypothetical protein